MRGIKAVAPGRQINVIGRVIEAYAKRFGYGVVREFTGHGSGRRSTPGWSSRTTTPRLRHGDGAGDDLHDRADAHAGQHDWDMWDDGWTVVTKDRRRCAQFEHTVW